MDIERGVVLLYRKEPVSVRMPAYRQVARSLSMVMPVFRARSYMSSQVDEAVLTTQFRSP